MQFGQQNFSESWIFRNFREKWEYSKTVLITLEEKCLITTTTTTKFVEALRCYLTSVATPIAHIIKQKIINYDSR